MCWHFNYACPDPFPMFYKTDQQCGGEEEPTSVAPQMSSMFRILLANRNKTKNILEMNKEVEADTQNNCAKSCHTIPLNSFKDTFLWFSSRVTGSVACFYGVRPFLFPSPPCKRRAGWNGLQGLQVLVTKHTNESGEAPSEAMNSSPQIQTRKQPGWNYSIWSLNGRAKVQHSQDPSDGQSTSLGMSTMRGTLLAHAEDGLVSLF